MSQAQIITLVVLIILSGVFSGTETAMMSLHMAKEVKIIRVGTGLGLRFQNDIVRSLGLKKGEEVMLKPESDGIKVIV